MYTVLRTFEMSECTYLWASQRERALLAFTGQELRTQNILQCTEHSHIMKNYPAQKCSWHPSWETPLEPSVSSCKLTAHWLWAQASSLLAVTYLVFKHLKYICFMMEEKRSWTMKSKRPGQSSVAATPPADTWAEFMILRTQTPPRLL